MAEFNSLPDDELPFPYDDRGLRIEGIPSILITRNEALFLDDSFTLMIERDADEQRIQPMRPIQTTAGLAVPMELMEKVGKAVVYTTQPKNEDKEYEIEFDVSELLMIREIASSYIKVGEEPVGYNLKQKVCNVLYSDELEQEENNKIASHLLKDIDLDLSESKVESNVKEQHEP